MPIKEGSKSTSPLFPAFHNYLYHSHYLIYFSYCVRYPSSTSRALVQHKMNESKSILGPINSKRDVIIDGKELAIYGSARYRVA